MGLALSDNPIRLVHDALWTLLEASADFTTMVKPANRIKTAGSMIDPDPLDTENHADFPRVRIWPAKMVPRLNISSNSHNLKVLWRIDVASGAQGTDVLMDLAWTIYRALSDWHATMVALTWKSKQFVWRTQSGEVDEKLGDKSEQRGVRGWTVVWIGETDMAFGIADLKP